RYYIHTKFLDIPVRAFLLILALVSFASSASAHHAVRGDPAAGRAVASACLACHGGQGLGPVAGIPTLAGQNESHLIKQLVEMRRAAKEREGTAEARPPEVESLLHSAR